QVQADLTVPGVADSVSGISSAPAVDPNNGAVYFTYNTKVEKIAVPAGPAAPIAASVLFTAAGDVNATPAIAQAALGGGIYFGDSAGTFYDVSAAGALTWSVALSAGPIEALACVVPFGSP